MISKTNTRREVLEKILKFWLPVVAWALIIFTFSAKPTPQVSQIYWKDFVIKKLAHVVEYFIFTILLYRALKVSGVKPQEAGVYSVILAVLYGASDEIHQSFTVGREARIRDVFFDTIGSVTALYFLWNLLPKAPMKLKRLAEDLQIL